LVLAPARSCVHGAERAAPACSVLVLNLVRGATAVLPCKLYKVASNRTLVLEYETLVDRVIHRASTFTAKEQSVRDWPRTYD
jgi:hypothetical protein